MRNKYQSKEEKFLMYGKEVENSFNQHIKVFENRIPNTVKVGESIYYSMPIIKYSPNATAGVAYAKFAKELMCCES